MSVFATVLQVLPFELTSVRVDADKRLLLQHREVHVLNLVWDAQFLEDDDDLPWVGTLLQCK